jgi:putative N6-adenine-specific DNA methylase
VLLAEVRGKGFKRPRAVPGGVVLLRAAGPRSGAPTSGSAAPGACLARIDSFRVQHLAQLDGRARHVPWASVLRPDIPFRVEAHCAKSRIYHSGAAAERIETAIRETLGATPSPEEEVTVRVRIEQDICTISLDTSGELLHRRGHKQAVNAAPMRETMAALFLRQCGFEGNEPLLDPMCGSGTLVIEAAEIAARLNPGRARSFAFEQLATFDAEAWARMRAVSPQRVPGFRFHGSDRDAGAIAMSEANAERAGVGGFTQFRQAVISDVEPPPGPPGLVMVNPPYGTRLGDRRELLPLYQALGQVLLRRFAGWRVGLVAADPGWRRRRACPSSPRGRPFRMVGCE